MSDFILLKDPSTCPACKSNTAPASLPGKCSNCGKQLFKFTDAIKKFEQETGLMEYWVWTGSEHGWKHRSHLVDQSSKALTRSYEIPKLPDDYGTDTYQARRIRESRIELREAMKKPKYKGRIIKTQASGRAPAPSPLAART
jgi:hypothetical protein